MADTLARPYIALLIIDLVQAAHKLAGIAHLAVLTGGWLARCSSDDNMSHFTRTTRTTTGHHGGTAEWISTAPASMLIDITTNYLCP